MVLDESYTIIDFPMFSIVYPLVKRKALLLTPSSSAAYALTTPSKESTMVKGVSEIVSQDVLSVITTVPLSLSRPRMSRETRKLPSVQIQKKQ